MKSYHIIHQSNNGVRVETYYKFSIAQERFDSLFSRDLYFCDHRATYKKKPRKYRIFSCGQLTKARLEVMR